MAVRPRYKEGIENVVHRMLQAMATRADADHLKRHASPCQPIIWLQLWSVGYQGMTTNIARLEYACICR